MNLNCGESETTNHMGYYSLSPNLNNCNDGKGGVEKLQIEIVLILIKFIISLILLNLPYLYLFINIYRQNSPSFSPFFIFCFFFI